MNGNMFEIIDNLIHDDYRDVDSITGRLHCGNGGIYHGTCVHNEFFQAGGGTSSPLHSYFYCGYLHRGIYVEPPIATHDIKRVLVPDDCPIQNSEYKNRMDKIEHARLEGQARRFNANYNRCNKLPAPGTKN